MIGMDNELQIGAGATKPEVAFKDAIDTSDQREQLHQKIRQLLKESQDAKDKGQWKKAWDLLNELSKLTRG
jgi:hypothetical protein